MNFGIMCALPSRIPERRIRMLRQRLKYQVNQDQIKAVAMLHFAQYRYNETCKALNF